MINKRKSEFPIFNFFTLLCITLYFSSIIYQAYSSNIITFSTPVYLDSVIFTFDYVKNYIEFMFIWIFSIIIVLVSLFLLFKMNISFNIKSINIFHFVMFIIISFPFLGFLYFIIF